MHVNAPSLLVQRSVSEAYFTGVLSDSIADVQCKKLLDGKVGSLLGIKTTQVAREYEMVEQHRDRIHHFVSENPNEREICLEIFVEPKAVDQLRNIKLAAYTEEKLKSIDEYYSTRDFAACNLTRLPLLLLLLLLLPAPQNAF